MITNEKASERILVAAYLPAQQFHSHGNSQTCVIKTDYLVKLVDSQCQCFFIGSANKIF